MPVELINLLCILCLLPISIIRIIYSNSKLVEISAVFPWGTITLLVWSTALLQGCVIMMINDSTKIPLLQLAWNVPVNISSVDADSQSSKCVTRTIFKMETLKLLSGLLTVCSISFPASFPSLSFLSPPVWCCCALNYSALTMAHITTDQPLNPCSFAQEVMQFFVSAVLSREYVFRCKLSSLMLSDLYRPTQ